MGLQPGKRGRWCCAWVLFYKEGGADAFIILFNEILRGRVQCPCIVLQKAQETLIYFVDNVRTAF